MKRSNKNEKIKTISRSIIRKYYKKLFVNVNIIIIKKIYSIIITKK